MADVSDITDSILNSVKKQLGPGVEYDHFDPELILDINSVFAILTQLGVGPKSGYRITGEDETWGDFFNSFSADEDLNLELVKTYVYLKVKLMFDISTLTSPIINAIEEQTKEFEWRLNVEVD